MRKSKKGKAVTLEITIWYAGTGQTIHLASNESDTLIATVDADGTKRRGHPKLFRELKKILKDNGAPAPP